MQHQKTPGNGQQKPQLSQREMEQLMNMRKSGDIQNRMKDIEATKAMERISVNIAKTMKIVDVVYDLYHDDVAPALRRLEKGITLDKNYKVVNTPNSQEELLVTYGYEYITLQMDKDLDVCRKFIDKVWHGWTYFEDTDIVSMSQYINRTLTLTLAATKAKEGTVDFSKYSYSLIGLHKIYLTRIVSAKIDNDIAVWGWISNSPDYFKQFGIKAPDNYEEIKQNRIEERKKEELERLKANKERIAKFEKKMEEEKALREKDNKRKMNMERRRKQTQKKVIKQRQQHPTTQVKDKPDTKQSNVVEKKVTLAVPTKEEEEEVVVEK